MRIHELLEACVEYAAFEGVLGCEPGKLQRHVQTLDSNVDDDLFKYTFSLLSRHPSIEVIITSYPVTPVTSQSDLGSAPLPSDYGAYEASLHEAPPVPTKKGKKRDDSDAAPKGFTPALPLIRVLDEDDGGADGPPIKKDDYQELKKRWGERLRIRTTSDEMYFRLTGSHETIAAIGPAALYTLMLVAQSRSEGLSSLQLAQAQNLHSKDIFYHVKVLLARGLLKKVPYHHQQTATSLNLFHTFADKNEVYLEWTRQNQPQPVATSSAVPASSAAIESTEKEVDDEPEEADEDDDDEDEDGRPYDVRIDHLGLHFPPLTETELMIGHVVKDRLIQVLDHPGLKNHQLRANRLLVVLGWRGSYVVANRRQLMRHVDALAKEGIVHRVNRKASSLLSLTKYNLANKGEQPLASTSTSEDIAQMSVQPVKAMLTQSFAYQVVKVVEGFGEDGGTQAQILAGLTTRQVRFVDYWLRIAEKGWTPPHLSHLAVCGQVESATRERRLRIFTIANYQRHLAALHQPPDTEVTPVHSTARHFADVSYRTFWPSINNLYATYDEMALGLMPSGSGKVKLGIDKTTHGRRGKKRGPRVTAERAVSNVSEQTTPRPRPSKSSKPKAPKAPKSSKEFKYDNENQERGRPRKWVQIIDEKGGRARHVLPNVAPAANIPPILIWIKKEGVLVPAPTGYLGLGPPPPIPAAVLAEGQTPGYYKELAEANASGVPPVAVLTTAWAMPPGESSGSSAPQQPRKRGRPSKATVVDDEEQGSKRSKTGNRIEVEVEDVPGVSDSAGPSTLAAVTQPADQPIVIDAETHGTSEPALRESSRQRKREMHTPEPIDVEEAPARTRRKRNTVEVVVPLEETSEALNLSIDPVPDLASLEAIEVQPVVGEAEVNAALQYLREETPEPLSEIEIVPPPADDTPKAGMIKNRKSLSMIRRRNEILQCLTDLGGVMERHKFRAEHRLWIARVAGSGLPNTPLQDAATMDRQVFERAMADLMDDGKVKKTTSMMPTTTGRWVRIEFFHIAGLPDDVVKTHMRSAQVQHANVTHNPAPPPTATDEATVVVKIESTSAKRQAFLRETNMVAFNYGWRTGRLLRAGLLFKAAIKAINAAPTSHSIVSVSPRIVAAPFFFESITVGEYLSCVMVSQYDEGFWNWLQDHRDTRLSDIPPEFASIVGAGESMRVSRMRSLLDALCTLRAVSTASITPEQGDFLCTTTTGEQVNVTLGGDIKSSPYFLLHDVVPVYRIATDDLSLAGVMSAATEKEADNLFVSIRESATRPNPVTIPRLPTPPQFPSMAEIKGVIDLSVEALRSFRQRARWSHSITPVFGQRRELDATLDANTGERLVADRESIERLAYDIAMPYDYAEAFLASRSQLIKSGIENEKNEKANRLLRPINQNAPSRAARLKHDADQKAIFDQLMTKVNATRERLEVQVRDIATRIGMDFTPELTKWVIRIRKRGEEMSDAEIERHIKAYRRSGTETGASSVKPARLAPPRRYRKERGTTQDPGAPKQKRNRHQWTKEDMDNLIDGEAIIRARAKEKVAHSLAINQGTGHDSYGRAALTQIFPGIKGPSFLNRIKKYNARPGAQAYFDRLVSEWYNVWVQYRGTDELPDDDILDVVEFDIKTHIAFLRAHVDKTKLRLNAPLENKTEKAVPDLPATVGDVIQAYRWNYKEEPSTIKIERMWESGNEAEDSKLHDMMMGSIVDDKSHQMPVKVEDDDPLSVVIKGLVKILVGSPVETWDRSVATKLMEGYDQRESVDPKLQAMIHSGILLSRRKIDMGLKADRAYQFSVAWENASNGTLPPSIWPEAEEFKRLFKPGCTLDFPLIGKAGWLAALMDMVSNDEVDFDFKPVVFSLVAKDPYNTRSLDDDKFEFDLRGTRRASIIEIDDEESAPPDPSVLRFWPGALEVPSDGVVKKLLRLVKAAGAVGLTKPEMAAQLSITPLHLSMVLAHLAASSKPSVFWTSSETARLVDISFWSQWTMNRFTNDFTLTDKSSGGVDKARQLPRRWLDIWGNLVEDEWLRLVRTVKGYIMSRPGQSEVRLRDVISPILDRAEQNDILEHLLNAGKVRRCLMVTGTGAEAGEEGVGGVDILPPLQATDVGEEVGIGWWPITEAVW